MIAEGRFLYNQVRVFSNSSRLVDFHGLTGVLLDD